MTKGERFLEVILGGLWRLVKRSPAALIGTGIALALIGGALALLFLELDSDQDRLVSPELPFQQRYLEHLRNFGDQEYLYAVILTEGTEEGRRRAEGFAESLAAHLKSHPDLFRAVYYRITPRDLGDGALLFVAPEEAESIAGGIKFLSPSIEAWARNPTLAAFLERTGELLGGGSIDLVKAPAALFAPFLESLAGLLGRMEDSLGGKDPEGPLFDLSGLGSRYFYTSDRRLLVMRVLPAKDFASLDVIGKPLAEFRRALEEVRAEYPGVEAGLTGRPVLQADEMRTTDRDTTRAAVVAILLVGMLFTVVLHGWLRPLLVVLCLLMAMAWTFGYATLSVGRLNLLSIVFALVLVGIGVDFGVHVVMRYVEARTGGMGVEESVRVSLFKTGPGVLLGAVTSVCAFYSVLGSDFIGLAELGQIGGTGILLCLLAMLTILPAMLLVAGRRNLFPTSTPRLVALPFLERASARPGRLLMLLAVISLLALPGVLRTRFDYNLLRLQARGLESVEYERRLVASEDESTWYAILTADSLGEVRRLSATLRSLPTVGKVESLDDFIPTDQARKAALYADAAAGLAEFPQAATGRGVPEAGALLRAMEALGAALEGLEERLFATGAGAELALLERSLGHVEASMALLREAPSRAARVGDLEARLRRELESLLGQLRRWLSAGEVGVGDLSPPLRDIFVGADGRFQVKAYPKGNVWAFEELERFVAELRRVDPEVSGVPVGVLESARLMHRTFLSAAALTLLLVSLILWLHARSLRYVLLALLPLGVGMLWLLELMGWLGLSFNLANFFAIPILIAIGVDGGVHFLARWKELGGSGNLFATSTPTAVALSFATTMIGFGGLLLAHHRGLASLGAVMVLGSLTGMLACMSVLPAALKLFGNISGR